MRNELKHIEEIENYLTGKMNTAEKTVFEKRIAEDENLASDVVLQKQIMERMQLNAFKKDLLVFHSGFESGVKSTWWSKGIYLNSFLALLVLGITFSATYYFYFSDDKSADTKTEQTQVTEPLLAQEITLKEDVIETEVEEPVETTPVKNVTPVKKAIPMGVVRSPGENKEPHYHFLMVYNTEEMEADKGITFQTADSKSFIHIPADILVDKDGFPVKGKVQIRYREYRNAAQTAFSGIPMVYSEKGQEYNFNSAGMFEIRAFQNGEELKVKEGKSFSVDYNVTEKLDSCFFFALNEENKKWEKKSVINYNNENEMLSNEKDTTSINSESNKSKKTDKGMLKGIVKSAHWEPKELDGVKMRLYKGVGKNKVRMDRLEVVQVDTGYVVQDIQPGVYSAEVLCKKHKKMVIENIQIGSNKITQLNVYLKPRKNISHHGFFYKMIHLFREEKFDLDTEVKLLESRFELQDTISEINPEAKNQVAKAIEKKNRENLSKEIRQSIEAYEKYSNLVNGLQCENFGVYNCDQIKRISEPVAISAKYIDEKGKKIAEDYLISYIDLNYNAAFSFPSQNFTCNRRGRNVLLLFTKNKKLYALPEDQFKKMNISASGDFTFKMNDITEKVKDPNDLKSFLGLK